MFKDKEGARPYNDQSLNQAKSFIKGFDANMGGTNILDPIKAATKQKVNAPNKRLFLLTDGQVHNKHEIFTYVADNKTTTKVHTFGIGSGCDRDLVLQTASCGRGSASFSGDNSDDLPGQVIEALKKSCNHQLSQCTLTWPDHKVSFGEIFKGENVFSYRMMSEDEFSKL